MGASKVQKDCHLLDSSHFVVSRVRLIILQKESWASSVDHALKYLTSVKILSRKTEEHFEAGRLQIALNKVFRLVQTLVI